MEGMLGITHTTLKTHPPNKGLFGPWEKRPRPHNKHGGAGVKARKGFAHIRLIIPSKKWPLVEPLTIGSLKVETELYARTAFGRLDEYESPPPVGRPSP